MSIKALMRHLPHNTPAENIYEGLKSLGFHVIGVKQMATNRKSAVEYTTTATLILFLITLPRTAKLQELLTLRKHCHIAIKVEPYKSPYILLNCEKFGHLWENCKQPPRCVWGWGHPSA
jgi:hypothetical protein